MLPQQDATQLGQRISPDIVERPEDAFAVFDRVRDNPADGPRGAWAPFPLGGRDGLVKGIAFLLQVGTLTSTGFE